MCVCACVCLCLAVFLPLPLSPFAHLPWQNYLLGLLICSSKSTLPQEHREFHSCASLLGYCCPLSEDVWLFHHMGSDHVHKTMGYLPLDGKIDVKASFANCCYHTGQMISFVWENVLHFRNILICFLSGSEIKWSVIFMAMLWIVNEFLYAYWER